MLTPLVAKLFFQGSAKWNFRPSMGPCGVQILLVRHNLELQINPDSEAEHFQRVFSS